MSQANGTTLKHQIEEAQDKLKLAILKAQYESVDWDWDAFLRGSDRVPAASADPPSKPSDRWYGRDWPRIRTIFDLDIFRSASRLVVAENGYCRGALQGVIDAVIGHGGNFSCEDEEVEAYLKAWSSDCWAGIDTYDDGPVRESVERQFLRRLLRDGETFLHADEEGARFLDPERCRDYSSGFNGWSYGIKHQVEPYVDVNVREEYSFIMEEAEQIFLPADEIIHTVIEGTDSTVKRGIPLFCYEILDSFLGANRIREAVSLGVRVRAKIALLWKIAYGDAQDADAMTLTNALRSSHNHRHGNRRDRDGITPDGTEVYTPEGLEPAPLPQDYTAAQLLAVQADLRCAGAGVGLPEYMISGDASNANYASTREAGTPFVRRAEGIQSLVRSAAIKLARKALRFAVANGRLTEDQVRTRFDYALPDVTVTDFDKKGQTIAVLVEKGILTKEEGRVALGYCRVPGEVA